MGDFFWTIAGVAFLLWAFRGSIIIIFSVILKMFNRDKSKQIIGYNDFQREVISSCITETSFLAQRSFTADTEAGSMGYRLWSSGCHQDEELPYLLGYITGIYEGTINAHIEKNGFKREDMLQRAEYQILCEHMKNDFVYLGALNPSETEVTLEDFYLPADGDFYSLGYKIGYDHIVKELEDPDYDWPSNREFLLFKELLQNKLTDKTSSQLAKRKCKKCQKLLRVGEDFCTECYT